MFKVNNKNTRRRRFGIFITYFFEHISHLCSSASIVNFEQVNAGWVEKKKDKPQRWNIVTLRGEQISMIRALRTKCKPSKISQYTFQAYIEKE